MSVLLSRQYLQEVEDMAFAVLADVEDSLVEAMIDGKGLAYGQIELSREERLLKYLDDEMNGVNDALFEVDPDEWERRRKQYLADAREAGVL